MSLASLWAVAVMALGAPRCAFFRRKKAPRALFGAVQRVGRQTQCRRGPVRAGLGLGADDLAAGDAVVGAQPQPRREVLGAGPFGHVGANLADHLQGRVRIHAVDPGQVHSRHLIQVGPDIEARRVPLMGLFTIGSRRFAVAAVLKPFQLGSRSHSAILA